MLLVTNNERVRACWAGQCPIVWVPGGHEAVLLAVRDRVHQGHQLLTHPLAGSIKPNETPFRSVAMTEGPGALDLASLAQIEAALAVCQAFPPRENRGEAATQALRADFAEIDFKLIEGAIGPQIGRSVALCGWS